MLFVFLGTDRQRARAACNTAAKKTTHRITKITDANTIEDLRSTLATGNSMFGEVRTVILDGVSSNEGMRDELVEALPALASSSDYFFALEEKPDVDLKKKLLKHAEKTELFESSKKKEYPTVFKLADYLKKGDKKNMWVAYQHELATGNAPEAIHGVLFWAAKQALLAARVGSAEYQRGRKLVASLVELPHHARRQGEELEYALERFILSSL